MEIFNDNNPKPVKSTNLQGGENNVNRKFGNRRALSVINHIVGGHNYPCVVNKRGLSKLNVVCDKINNPITRSTKKPKTGANDFSIWEEEEEEEKDVEEPVPMSFEQTETISEEKDQTEEIEMEDIFEEGVIDIDNSDTKNPLAVVEYIEDMYAFYKKIEVCVSPNYMANTQSDINERMRAILIDWLIEVHHKFELREETLFLTVNLIDRFLAKQVVVRKKLQLVGLVAMLLACKYEEVSVPVVDDLVFISDKAYSRTQIIETERLMLNTLQFNMAVPTGYVFMRRFLKAAQSDQKLELLSFFLMELSLVEYEMLQFSPSFVAAASIYTAQCTLYGVGQWNKTCEWYTSYTEDQLSECSRLIVGYHQKAGTGKLTGIYRKYSTSRYGYAAKCEPAHFLVKTE